MTNMFKKSLVALAIAGTSTGVMAADIASGSDTVTVSSEYFAVAPAGVINSGDISLFLGAEYAVGDVITLTFSGGDALDVDSLPSTINAVDPEGGTGTPRKSLTLGFLDSDVTSSSTVVQYRVTDITGGATDTTTGLRIDFGSAAFDSTKSQSGVSVSFSAATGSNASLSIDSGTNGNPSTSTTIVRARSVDLFDVVDQFDVAVASANELDGVINVETNRVDFIDGTTAGVKTDTLLVNVTDASDAAVVGDLFADMEGVSFTLEGRFDWITDTGTAANIQPATGVITLLAGTTLASCAVGTVTSDAITIDCPTATAAGNLEVQFDVGVNATAVPAGATAAPASIALPAGSFEVNSTVDYSFTATTTEEGSRGFFDIDAGAWTLNASETFIPYMPYSSVGESAISQIITITNNGSQTGEVSIDVTDEAGVTTSFNSADLGGLQAAPGVTRITGNLVDAMTAAGLLDGSGTKRFSLNIIVNDKNDAISVYSAYNVNGNDRGWVQNDSVVVNRVKN